MTGKARHKREPLTDVKNQTKELASNKKDFQTNTEGGEKLWDSDLKRIWQSKQGVIGKVLW